MFITKKYLSRRTLLRGAGAALALPFLESMVPAQTPLAQTAAQPMPRFMGIFSAHGWAAGAGSEEVNLSALHLSFPALRSFVRPHPLLRPERFDV